MGLDRQDYQQQQQSASKRQSDTADNNSGNSKQEPDKPKAEEQKFSRVSFRSITVRIHAEF